MIEVVNWLDIEYLREGNDVQKKCYFVLKEVNIISILKEFDPLVVGTIPIGINV